MLNKGDKIPTFSLQNAEGKVITNDDLLGKTVVFYFYPKDDTPGCTKEGQAFSDHINEFSDKNTIVYGVSKDSVEKHKKFCDKYQFKHDLLSDEQGVLCDQFGVWQEKKMYGKAYMGIVRATFLVDENGIILHVWPKVKVPGHAEDVLNQIDA